MGEKIKRTKLKTRHKVKNIKGEISAKNEARKEKKRQNPRVKLHKSFRRSYWEDFQRDLEVPGIMYHIFASFRIIFKNWKLFIPLIIIAVLINVIAIGLMSQETYTEFQDSLDETSESMGMGDIGNVARAGLLLMTTITTGGLAGEDNEVSIIFGIVVFLILWLVTIYLLRHILAKHKIRLRDGLYNGMTPLISTFVVFFVAVVQCVPIFLLIIATSAAVSTNFLATPFYALVFFIFAAVMIILSGYLLSSTIMALVAVTAPGLYPMNALHAASDLMAGRRIKFLIRIVALVLALVIMWILVMMPLILFDLWMKTFEWAQGIPFIPICLNILTCFTGIYLATYLYMYYRWMLKYKEEK